jgi:xanthine dehydrogenase small subunit
MTKQKPSQASLNSEPLMFVRRGETLALNNVPPDRTLLDLLREDLRSCDTKEGCAAGDCGACTVVVAEASEGRLSYRAINSCIRPAHSVHGLAVWTAGDLAASPDSLHPAQQAMVDHHGSQCGFCTPGCVMSLFGLYQDSVYQGHAVNREQAQHALSGNLCRCTGYRPIVQAACHMGDYPVQRVDEPSVLQALAKIEPRSPHANYVLPERLEDLLRARSQSPQATLIAGATDAGLTLTQGRQRWQQVIDLSRVDELRQVEDYPRHIAIGAAVPLQHAFEALAQERPHVQDFANRFAGWPIRQSGTLGGNVANGSPIGDSMPLLIALGAHVVLMAWRRHRIVHRELPLENLYTGYRQNLMAPDEVLCWIKVPRPTPHEWLGAYKVSKRVEDDISAICLVVQLQRQGQRITQASIGVGGVAATPVRAVRTEAALLGQRWTPDTVQKAQAVLRQEFDPISDMRASSAYRREVLGNLLQRAWLESTGQTEIRLEDLA